MKQRLTQIKQRFIFSKRRCIRLKSRYNYNEMPFGRYKSKDYLSYFTDSMNFTKTSIYRRFDYELSLVIFFASLQVKRS